MFINDLKENFTDLPLSEDGEGQAIPHMHAAHEVRVLEPLVIAEHACAVVCYRLPGDLRVTRESGARRSVQHMYILNMSAICMKVYAEMCGLDRIYILGLLNNVTYTKRGCIKVLRRSRQNSLKLPP